MARGGDYYAVLGLTPAASEGEIKAAFRKLAHAVHPDRAGADPSAAEKFKSIREAYEVLADPARRSTYDRRHERASSSSPFYGTHWKHAGTPATGGVGNKATAAAGNDINLEDIFNDFGDVDLGFGKRGSAKAAATGARPRTTAHQHDPIGDFKAAAAAETWPGAGESQPGAGTPKRGFGFGDAGWSSGGGGRSGGGKERRAEPEAGGDVRVNTNFSSAFLGSGGMVTVEYDRHVRADDGHTLVLVRELHELRVPPDVRDGDELRVPKHGHAGAGGGPYGDLVATLHIVGAGPRMKMPRPEPSRVDEVLAVDVAFTEAVLGGRVEVDTPQGRVRLSIPAGTSSGARFRLKGKGRTDTAGEATDAHVEVRITVPKVLDEESRRLIERFAELNPGEF